MKITKKTYDEIDFDALTTIIRAKLGFKVDINYTFVDGKVVVSTDNLVSLIGILKHALASIILDNFGGGLSDDGSYYWLPLNFRYENLEGCRNGLDFLCMFWYFEEKMWIIK